MGERTAIAWTDHTFNPWWGCQRVSDGCLHCYAEAFAHRYGHAVWGPTAPRRFFGEKHWREPVKWHTAAVREGVRRRVFCSSMADVFEARPDLAEHRERLYRLILDTPGLDWLLLTKRPENVARLLPFGWGSGWPNVWIGTTVEHQRAAEERIPVLAAIPAAVRFLSVEPMIGPVVLRGLAIRSVQWVICGGESGAGARTMDEEWAYALRRQCEESGIAFFMKQLGGRANKRDVIEAFPEALRVRQFPVSGGARRSPGDHTEDGT